MVSDRDSFLTARRITREEGILAGGSCGTAVWAALEVGRELGPDDVIVVLLPDSGRGYLSKIYNDEWMADYGFLRAGGETVAEVMGRKTRDLPPLVHVHPDETVRSAIALLKEFGVSQMPVVKAEPPLALAEVVGSVTDRSLLDRAFHDPSIVDRPLGDVMEAAAADDGHGRDGRRGRGPAAARRRRGRARQRSPRRHPHPIRPAGVPGPAPHRHRRPVSEARGFETRAIHAGQDPDPATGAVVHADLPDLHVRPDRGR